MNENTSKSVIVGGEVKGDITSCKTEKVLVSTERPSAFSLVVTDRFQTYNVCTREVIADYTIQNPSWLSITLLGVLLIGGLSVFLRIIFD